jgi:uncharacterized repeat protein (TIGR01451 family)
VVQIGDDGADQTPGNNSDTEVTPVNAAPDLQITKEDGTGSVNPGGTITYTLTYTNSGNQAAAGVVITETLPLHTSLNPATPAGWHQVGATSQYTYSVGSLNVGPGQTVSFIVTVVDPVPAGVTTINNTAQIGGSGGDSNSTNNSDSEATAIAGTQHKTYLPLVLKDD